MKLVHRADLKQHTIKHKDKAKINYAFLKQGEIENTGILGVPCQYLLRTIIS